jgi:hypothetical protein
MATKRVAHSEMTAETLMARGMWAPAERLLIAELTHAEKANDIALSAQCHANLGHAAEVQGRIGDAVRHWSRALELMARIGLQQSAEAERLSRLIRRWHEIPRVWISYAHKDEEHVRRIMTRLRRRKIMIVSDHTFIPGHMIQRQVHIGISRSPKYVVIWSRNALDRPWVDYELQVLQDQRRADLEGHAFDNTVIFYCLDNTPLPGDHADDIQIYEERLGIDTAIGRLASSIKTSELSM